MYLGVKAETIVEGLEQLYQESMEENSGDPEYTVFTTMEIRDHLEEETGLGAFELENEVLPHLSEDYKGLERVNQGRPVEWKLKDYS